MGTNEKLGPFENKFLELPQRVGNDIGEMQQRWNNRLHWTEARFHKDYIEGRLGSAGLSGTQDVQRLARMHPPGQS